MRLLDESTNRLDLGAVIWLEEWIKIYIRNAPMGV